MVLWESARWGDIAQFCEAAKEIFADNALFLNVWGGALTNLARPAEALIILDRALGLAPAESALHRNRATALILLGRGEESVEAFSRSVTPWTGDLPAKEASATRQAYAALSAGYDGNVLHQSFTRRLSEHLTRALPNHAPLQVLELGCGTGLLAARLPPGVEHLVGVDLSPDMLAQARARGGYHELIEGDLQAVMTNQPGPFDTIAAACVLYHMADLQPIFTQVARLLSPEGVFVFSTDPMADSTEIGVSSPGEFCHSRSYLRRLAVLAGLEEIAIEVDSHRGPPGFWCVFRTLPRTAPAKVY